MSNFPFDLSAAPSLRSGDLVAIPSGADVLKYLDASTLNRLISMAAQLGDNQLNGSPFLSMLAGTPDLAGTGKARLSYISGRLSLSRENTAWESLDRGSNDRHASYFGIKGDGTDETARWQDALGYFSDQGSGAKPGRLLVDPTGLSMVSDTLLYQGDVSRPLIIDCPTPGNFGLTGFTLKWASGAGTGKPVLRLLGANCSIIRNLCIDGSFLAKYLIHIDNRSGAGTFIPSSGVIIDSCSLYAHGGSGCAGIAIGNANPDVANTQTSEVIVKNCRLFGRQSSNGSGHGPEGYGIKVLAVGNCKNFWIYDTAFGNHRVHADLGGSGNAVVSGGGFGLATQACVIGGGNTVIEKLDYEGQPGSGYAAPLVGGQGGGANASYQLKVSSCEAISPLQLAGGDYTQDDVMILSVGKVTLEGNTFVNQRADTAESRIVVAGDYVPMPTGGGSGCGIHSRSNWYRASNTYAPIFDTGGNRLTGANFYPTITSHSVISEGDTGGRESVDIHNLRDTRGSPLEFTRLRPQSFGDGYQTTPLVSGASNQATHQILVAAAALANGAAPIWRSILFLLNKGQRIRAARIRVDTPFAGVAGALTLHLGIIAPGGADSISFLSSRQLVLPCDAKTAGTYGAQESEKGIGLHPAFLSGEGFYPDSAFLNGDGTYSVVLVMQSVPGNNLNLTAGQATVMLDTSSDDL